MVGHTEKKGAVKLEQKVESSSTTFSLLLKSELPTCVYVNFDNETLAGQ